MVLRNKTRQTIISKNLKAATSLRDKLLGLHRKTNPRSLLFKTRFGVHTFFLKDKIDILVLSDKMEVVKAKTVRPNSICLYAPKHQIVVELPKGAILRSKTKVGDNITFK